jgi:hypothetical protein
MAGLHIKVLSAVRNPPKVVGGFPRARGIPRARIFSPRAKNVGRI